MRFALAFAIVLLTILALIAGIGIIGGTIDYLINGSPPPFT